GDHSVASAEDPLARERNQGGKAMSQASIFFGALLLAVGPLLCQVPEMSYDSTPNLLKLPPHIYLGEVAGVATTSKGNIVVYTRTGEAATMGGSRMFTHGGSRLFEFYPTVKSRR